MHTSRLKTALSGRVDSSKSCTYPSLALSLSRRGDSKEWLSGLSRDGTGHSQLTLLLWHKTTLEKEKKPHPDPNSPTDVKLNLFVSQQTHKDG